MISEFHNFDNGYIARVNITLQDLPQTLDIAGYTLIQKSEFHISLICAKRIAALINPDDSESVVAEIVSEFKKFITKKELRDFSLVPEYRLVQVDTRKTLIVMANVPELSLFFSQLERKYKVRLPVQPTHITLYTLQPEKGIGLLSYDELEKHSRVVAVPQLQSLCVVK